ncbi:unnamed protein product [Triticum turgidum subsp. durum]|uniref:Serine aminopeptidase S33 domain-containing protein n=1 Tax=Triticum turgidum subsp. durum TaxID=4567 RepID=A0A9R1QD59_TRITD|nr:unnamed protein product [Triticum turgidum subsp. durum]
MSLRLTGHGGSDGLHGYVPSLDYVIEDMEVLLDKIMLENPDVPCFLLGHSTGGAVVLKASLYAHIRTRLEGIILTSPAVRVKPAHPIVGVILLFQFPIIIPIYPDLRTFGIVRSYQKQSYFRSSAFEFIHKFQT